MKRKIQIFDILIIIGLLLITLVSFYPFVFTIAGSFNNGIDYQYGGVWIFPREITLANYQAVLGDPKLYLSFGNTVLVTVLGTFASLLFTSFVAYGMSQKSLRGKKFFWTVNLITMFFSGGMVPFYLLILTLGLYDNFLVYIVPSVYSVYNMIILSSFFRSIDSGIRESAMIDGASEFRIWTLYLPISKPALATVGLWIAVSRWNTYMPTLLYTSREENLWLLQYYMMRLIKEFSMPETEGFISDQVSAQTVTYASIVVSVLPIMLVYPFLSKYFTKGIMVGALKG
mgnify:FL=1